MFAKIDLDGRLVLTRQAFQGGPTPSMSRLENGLFRVRITWGRPVELTNVVLPGPMSGLTVQWHSSWGKTEPADVISTLEDEGYQIAFTAPG